MNLGSHKDVAVLGWLDSHGWHVYLSVFQGFCNLNANRPFLWFALFHGIWAVFSKSLWHLFQLDERSYSSWRRDLVEGWKLKQTREKASQRTQWGSWKSQYATATGLMLLPGGRILQAAHLECLSSLWNKGLGSKSWHVGIKEKELETQTPELSHSCQCRKTRLFISTWCKYLHVGLYSVFPGDACLDAPLRSWQGMEHFGPSSGQHSIQHSGEFTHMLRVEPSTCLSVLLAQGPLV